MKYESESCIVIPGTCPTCNSGLLAITWKAFLGILKHRSWIVCESDDCDYAITAEDRNKELCCQ
ncbi:MAG: hypothetical protein HOD60_08960 [Candidatus Nitrosopelagicus sp.]|jgi:hypothetical protein|nr:hypothetical protein [Candidatus Nitrosopelagicus sp.]